MSGSGPEAPQPSDAEEARLQEAEQDWAAAKAFYDNLVSKKPRPVSADGRAGQRAGMGYPEVGG